MPNLTMQDPRVQGVLADPQFKQLWTDYSAKHKGGTTPLNALIGAGGLNKYMDSKGLKDYSFHADASGQPVLHQQQSLGSALGSSLLKTALVGGALYGGMSLLPAGGAGGGANAAVQAGGRVAGASGFPVASTGGSFLSKLGGIKGILGTAQNIGSVASGAAQGRAQGRLAENQYNLMRDQVAGQNASRNVDLDSQRIRQAILLSLLSGAQDAQITPPDYIASRMPKMTGGLRPSAIAGKEDIVNAARQRIIEALLSGQHIPGLSDAVQANGLDKVLSVLGLGSAFAGASQLPKPATR